MNERVLGQIETLKAMLDESKRVVFLGGAGTSTESGIPDFRSADGAFRAAREFGYPPETLLSHDFFLHQTETFFRYYKKYLICPDAKPNRAHRALSELERQGKLTALITQNIDNLHTAAGTKNVLELHGSVYRNTCMRCSKAYPLETILAADGVPICPDCGGIIKPDVVLYGEGLDEGVLRASVKHISEADMLIIGGTSLVVYPAAGLADYFRGKHLVVINLSATHRDANADLTIAAPIGEVLGAAVGVE